MRKFIQSLLLLFAALVFAGTASAVVIDVEGPAPTMTVAPSDEVTLYVTLDSELVTLTSYQFHVSYDPAVLSYVDALPTPPTDFVVYGSNPEAPGALIVDGIRWTGSLAFDQSVMTLVFHVMNSATPSMVTIVEPYLNNYGTNDSFYDQAYSLVPLSDVTIGSGVTIHVPEPTTTMLMGLGLLGILYAGRRR